MLYTTYWSNDSTSSNGSEPLNVVPVSVTKGLYSVPLGDADYWVNNHAISSTIFTNDEVYLRIWFNDGVHGSQLLAPDQRIAAVGYAMRADDADTLDNLDSTDFMRAHQGAIYRWNSWSSYGQAHGQWYGNNDSTMFGGGHPSNWGDGSFMAYQMSTNKSVLCTLFNRKGYAGKNATVYADEWYSYSSTNSKHAGALFRIRNTTGASINWTVYWYRTAYGGWSERASISINGANTWNSGGSNYGPGHSSSHVISVPPNQVSTVTFIAASSSDSGTRSCFLGFYNDCLDLPTGLEYVDDLDMD
ncbi:MAG: hypothetical protein HN341_01725 [Verrucomicrobia bacterium]|nr:hypothetical protein [Verrucomicrobiota bacterium]